MNKEARVPEVVKLSPAKSYPSFSSTESRVAPGSIISSSAVFPSRSKVLKGGLPERTWKVFLRQ